MYLIFSSNVSVIANASWSLRLETEVNFRCVMTCDSALNYEIRKRKRRRTKLNAVCYTFVSDHFLNCHFAVYRQTRISYQSTSSMLLSYHYPHPVLFLLPLFRSAAVKFSSLSYFTNSPVSNRNIQANYNNKMSASHRYKKRKERNEKMTGIILGIAKEHGAAWARSFRPYGKIDLIAKKA